LDEDFARRMIAIPGRELTGIVQRIALAPDGRILVTGDIAYGSGRRMLVRFHPDGSPDEEFLAATAPLTVGPGHVGSPRAAVRPDGTIAVVDVRIGRPPTILRADGTILGREEDASIEDPWAQPVVALDGRLAPSPLAPSVRSVVREASYGYERPFLETRYRPGSDGEFQLLGVHPHGGALVLRWVPVPDVRPAEIPMPDVVAPEFLMPRCGNDEDLQRYRGEIARLGADGEPQPLPLGPRLDPAGEATAVSAIAFQADGSVLMAGALPVSGEPDASLALWRITPDGVLDPAFRHTTAGEIAGAGRPLVRTMIVLPDGRIVIGGGFTAVQGRPRAHVARLRADGTIE
jgi:uncharacterized delta-60 repeat protein